MYKKYDNNSSKLRYVYYCDALITAQQSSGWIWKFIMFKRKFYGNKLCMVRGNTLFTHVTISQVFVVYLHFYTSPCIISLNFKFLQVIRYVQ